VSNNIYFTALVETAAWGAELATELAGNGERGHIYVVDPSGPFEDDPNVTNRRFLVNPTQAYRTPHLLRIVAELPSCDGEVEEPKRSHRPPICPRPIGMRGGAQTRTGKGPRRSLRGSSPPGRTPLPPSEIRTPGRLLAQNL